MSSPLNLVSRRSSQANREMVSSPKRLQARSIRVDESNHAGAVGLEIGPSQTLSDCLDAYASGFILSLTEMPNSENVPRDFRCPRCGAPPHRGCETPDGLAWADHAERMTLAKAASQARDAGRGTTVELASLPASVGDLGEPPYVAGGCTHQKAAT